MVKRSNEIQRQPENYDAYVGKLTERFAKEDAEIKAKTKEQMDTLIKNMYNRQHLAGEYEVLSDKEVKKSPTQKGTLDEVSEITRNATKESSEFQAKTTAVSSQHMYRGQK